MTKYPGKVNLISIGSGGLCFEETSGAGVGELPSLCLEVMVQDDEDDDDEEDDDDSLKQSSSIWKISVGTSVRTELDCSWGVSGSSFLIFSPSLWLTGSTGQDLELGETG